MRRVLRERRWTIVFVTVMFTGVAVLFDLRSPVTWAPYAEVEITTLTPNTPFLGIRTLKPEDDSPVVAGRVALKATEPEVLLDARRRLGDAVPAGYSLEGRVQATASRAPGSLLIIVRDTERRRGVLAANALAESVVARVRKRELKRLDTIISAVRRQRRTITASGRRGTRTRFRRRIIAYARRHELDQQLAALETVRAIAEPARVVRPAVAPETPEFKPGKRTWPAIYLGLNIGLVAAFVLDAFARRSRDPRRLVQAAGLPVLAEVPKPGRRRADAIRLAYEHLRSATTGLGREQPAGVAVVTSPDPGAGKSTVALGLVRAAASTGRRACLVECDLHRPTVALRLGLEGAGLSDLLGGDVTREEAMIEVHLDDGRPMTVVHAGTRGRVPSQALGSPEFAGLVEWLKSRHDLVVIDAPPILAGSDALALIPQSEAVLLCGRLGRTPVDELEAARTALDRLPPIPAGLVITGVPVHSPRLLPQRSRYAPLPASRPT